MCQKLVKACLWLKMLFLASLAHKQVLAVPWLHWKRLHRLLVASLIRRLTHWHALMPNLARRTATSNRPEMRLRPILTCYNSLMTGFMNYVNRRANMIVALIICQQSTKHWQADLPPLKIHRACLANLVRQPRNGRITIWICQASLMPAARKRPSILIRPCLPNCHLSNLMARDLPPPSPHLMMPNGGRAAPPPSALKPAPMKA